MTTPVLSSATCRLTLECDANGDPYFPTVCSPVSFTQASLAVVPKRHVIPVIFVPGIMGTNLRGDDNSDGYKNEPAWCPPNGTAAGIAEGSIRKNQQPVERQKQMNPATTIVDTEGPVILPPGIKTLSAEEAKRRGWGELHWDSYGAILTNLEIALNDRHENVGKPDAKKMAVWTVAETLKKDREDVLHIWNPVKGDAQPLTADEYQRVGDYYYPVWACGYNWLQSNEQSADRLVNKIDEVLAWYHKTGYFIPEGRVIIVTHSMGGLVARRAAQLVGDKILGVVHGVQPVAGAPVVYRRFRAGTEVNSLFDLPGAVAALILGWDAADVTCVMANSPGPLELLPTKHYPTNWLKVEQEIGNGHRRLLFELPESDPYLEIYSKRTQDVWWGMVDETLIDPANIAKEKYDMTPFEMYLAALKRAKKFHDKVELECHPNTYAHYGSDADQISFGSVHWTTNTDIPDDKKNGLRNLLAEKSTTLGWVNVVSNRKLISLKLNNKSIAYSDFSPDAGDGTVPMQSGALIKTGAKHVFQMKGFAHAESYKDKNVIENVLYSIGKIIQGAIPAKDLPQTKGEICPDLTEASVDRSSASASQPSPAVVS